MQHDSDGQRQGVPIGQKVILGRKHVCGRCPLRWKRGEFISAVSVCGIWLKYGSGFARLKYLCVEREDACRRESVFGVRSPSIHIRVGFPLYLLLCTQRTFPSLAGWTRQTPGTLREAHSRMFPWQPIKRLKWESICVHKSCRRWNAQRSEIWMFTPQSGRQCRANRQAIIGRCLWAGTTRHTTSWASAITRRPQPPIPIANQQCWIRGGTNPEPLRISHTSRDHQTQINKAGYIDLDRYVVNSSPPSPPSLIPYTNI